MADALVLLSAGRDPQSGRPAPAPDELAAVSLAGELGLTPIGVHAGGPDEAVARCAGHGIERIDYLTGGDDVVSQLTAYCAEHRPAVILAGRRACGGEDSGLLPYMLAQRLGMPIVSDISEAEAPSTSNLLRLTQKIARDTIREVTVPMPCVLTVTDDPAPPPFVFAAMRRVLVREVPSPSRATPAPDVTRDRPYRKRPQLITNAATTKGQVLINPTPQEAARVILAHLRTIGVLAQ